MNKTSDTAATYKGRSRYLIILCVLSLLINIIGMLAARSMGIPLYLDAIGTMTAAVLGGYMPGVLVGFLTCAFGCVMDVNSIYLLILSMVTALLTTALARRRCFKRVWKAYLSLPLYAIIIGMIRMVLYTYIEFESPFKGTGLDVFIFDHIHNLIASQILSYILIELFDKAIVLTGALILIKLLSKKFMKSNEIGGIWQAPLNKNEINKLVNIKTRSVSLRTKMVFILVVAMVFMAFTAATISAFLFTKSIIEDNESLADGMASLAADAIDAERVDEYILNGENVKGYKETREMLYKLRDSSPDVEYVYVYKISEDGCHVVFDLDTDDVEGSAPGDVIEFDETFYPYLPKLFAGQAIDPIISNDSFGWLLTVYKPVYDSNGVCRCYAAVDVSMHKLSNYAYGFMVKLISILFGALIFIVVMGIWFTQNNIILPINTIASCAGEFAYNTDTERRDSVERTKKLQIRTGDEVENLYNVFVTTMGETMDHIEDIRNKTETISNMQNGLIMVLAEMVESRDQCTGDHVRKTAAYVRLILEEMKRRGAYKDQLSDQFIADVINAAPLHDIGKIHISDVILNKPGKLTDEEFEIMKLHTVYGSEIIKKAMDIVPETGYLSEARNVAEFHHEKWNGKGYPRGLSGEDIPLSARVMAVADVFDALVSRRSYKQPFTFEKAMSIIKEDAGTHFDPVVAEVFLGAQDKVREIAEEFKDDPGNDN